MLNVFEILIPLALVVMISLPLIKVFQGKVTKQSAKSRVALHVASFFGLMLFTLLFQFAGTNVFAAASAALEGTTAQGLGFLSAALATGMSALGAGIAVAAAAPAAIGAFSENEKNFGKSMIFVVLGEGVAIYGVLISILIIGKI